MTFAEQIHTLVVNKQYGEALQFFKANKHGVENIGSNAWLVSDMLTALRNTKAYEAAYKFLEIYALTINNHTPLRVLMSYGWLLYAHYKDLTQMKDAQFDTIEAHILQLLQLLQTTNDSYANMLIENIFRINAQRHKQQTTTNPNYVKQLCNLVDVNKLTATCTTIQVDNKGTARDMELASMQETWYSMHSKALLELQQYEACIALCDQALKNIHNMHYHNRTWMERRKAQSLIANAKHAEALAIYTKIVKVKNDWFLKNELAQLYLAMHNPEAALMWAKQAAMSAGPINFKIELIEFIGKLLMQSHNHALAAKHFYLCQHIRNDEKWKISNTLRNNIIATDAQGLYKNTTKVALKSELSLYWGHDTLPNDRVIGTIETLHTANEKGRSGILKDNKGQKAFFFVPNNIYLYQHLAIGKTYSYACITTDRGLRATKMKQV